MKRKNLFYNANDDRGISSPLEEEIAGEAHLSLAPDFPVNLPIRRAVAFWLRSRPMCIRPIATFIKSRANLTNT